MDEIFGGKWIQMKKIDSVVLRETGYIALWVLIFSVLMEAVFLVTGYFDYTVPLGNLLGAAATVLNFFLMGLTVQKAVERDRQAGNADASSDMSDTDGEEERPASLHKDAVQVMKLSQTLRMLMMLAFAAVGALVPCFNLIAVVIPYIFPRIAIMLRPIFLRGADDSSKGGENLRSHKNLHIDVYSSFV